ncbi:MAG: GNAT family N-acetyltransferase [Erysipelotrichaceae bacterium]|nr:GNAT family N-acetyltransferase [Erysipelotrichaceae bacterium]
MALQQIEQPELIQVNDKLRLRKYDGNYEKMLAGYQDPYVYQNSEGIFDEDKIPDLEYVKRMSEYLSRVGEMYFIEWLQNGEYISIGDVTIKEENPPIAIWQTEYRNKGIGSLVMSVVVQRLKELGYHRISHSTVYKWNDASLQMHLKLGFQVVEETDKEYLLNLEF